MRGVLVVQSPEGPVRIPNLLPLLVLAAVGCDDGEREPTYFDPRLSARVLVNVAVADT